MAQEIPTKFRDEKTLFSYSYHKMIWPRSRAKELDDRWQSQQNFCVHKNDNFVSETVGMHIRNHWFCWENFLLLQIYEQHGLWNTATVQTFKNESPVIPLMVLTLTCLKKANFRT
jgi:hypothetical protein